MPKTIAFKNLPPKLPVVFFAVAYLYLDKYNAPGWLWGVCISMAVVITIGTFLAIKKSDSVDIFKDK